jgi:signal transduction histidine kinase
VTGITVVISDGKWQIVRRGAALRSLVESIRSLLEQGITPELSEPLQKRIRLTNALSLLGAFLMVVSVPFDWVEAPRWMIAEDVIGGFAYACFPFLNRYGLLTGSRLFCLLVSNAIVLSNALLLGSDSGSDMVFIALSAVPFTLFDLDDWLPLATGVLFSVVGFAVGQSGLLTGLRTHAVNYRAAHYYFYSAVVAFIVLLFSSYRTSLANASAERALRHDIAERLRAERELEQSRQTSIYSAKMAALGEMSGNIAHEVNNPLAAILLRVQRLRSLVTNGSVDAELVVRTAREIEKTVDRIRRIVDALRTFARDAENDPLRPEPVGQVVRDAVELCAERFRQHAIVLVLEPIPDDLHVECRSIQISQIVLNLLSNAHDAVEKCQKRRVRIATEPDESEVRIAVIDSGPGVAPAHVNRIMEPFFTTKAIGKGTGLGLSVSKGFAEANGGRLAYDPTSPETRFVLTLRRSRPQDGDLATKSRPITRPRP